MSDPTLPALSRQVAHQCRQLQQAQGLPFAEHLPARTIHNTLRQVGGFFRHRLYTPAVTLWTFLSQLLDPDPSCRQAVARFLAWRVAQGLPCCSPENSAYCKARSRLPEELLARLTRNTGQQVLDDADGAWLWQGRPVKVVDGTGLSMPDTPANQKEYPQPNSQKPGVGFPLLRLVVIFSLAVGTVLEAAFAPYRGKGTGELSLFRTLSQQLQPGDVLLGDRIFCTYWEVTATVARGADAVLRLHGGRRPINFRLGQRLGPGDRLVWWKRPARPEWMSRQEYDKVPKELRLRGVQVRLQQRGFRVKKIVVVTTLLEPALARREELADLYRARWQAELDLRALKQTLQMDVLRGQSPEMVRKELWGHLLVYNLVRGLMAQAARAWGLKPRQVSFKGALQTINAFWPLLKVARSEVEALRLWLGMIWAMGQHEVGDRPDRYEPRKVKRRPKNYDRLNEPRAKAKKRLATMT
jgi:Transposase DDE domain